VVPDHNTGGEVSEEAAAVAYVEVGIDRGGRLLVVRTRLGHLLLDDCLLDLNKLLGNLTLDLIELLLRNYLELGSLLRDDLAVSTGQGSSERNRAVALEGELNVTLATTNERNRGLSSGPLESRACVLGVTGSDHVVDSDGLDLCGGTILVEQVYLILEIV